MGQIIGSVLAIMVLSAIWQLLFRRFLSDYAKAGASVVAAVVTATILYGFGSADGGSPNFTAGLLPYGIAGVIVFGLWSIGIARTRKATDG